MKFSAAQILAIPLTQPERLFTRDDFVNQHKALVKEWHPDVNPEAADGKVVAHINALKDAAKKKNADGTWSQPGVLELKLTSSTILFRYKRRVKFELGEMLYSSSKVAFLADASARDLIIDGNGMLERLTYRNEKMADEMQKYFPHFTDVRRLPDGRTFLIGDKTRDVFLLKDVLEVSGGKIDPKHVAWIISGLYNIACYLEYAVLTHNGISLSSVFISPKHHSTLLLGGWWYCVSRGDRLVALPDDTKRFAPQDMLASKTADSRIDLASIKHIGRCLLGDATGMTLASSGAPAPMVTFLRLPSTGSARKDYASWMKSNEASFGQRRFTEMKITEDDIYKLEG